MKTIPQLLCLLAAIAVMAAPTRAANPDLPLTGLGLHQETGRNIYLGGIYLEHGATPGDDPALLSGRRIMEYRVIARRTSIRSLLGGMLLQSEVATGRPPDPATVEFANALLSTVNSSLYAGDSLQIAIDGEDATIARLNGHELARVEGRAVADYLLMGWVGESGPSTVFRNQLTAGEIDPSLLAELDAHTYSAQREAEVARWVQGPEEAAAPGGGTGTAAVAAAESGESAEVAVGAPASGDSGATPRGVAARATTAAVVAEDPQNYDAAIADTITAAPSPAAPVEEPPAAAHSGDTDTQPTQLASLVTTAALLPNPLQKAVEALDVQQYFQRLAEFHATLVRRVYGEIRYPRRAVRRGLEGRLELDVTMMADGEVLDIEIAQASGHTMLDEAALKAATSAFGKGAIGPVDPVAIAEFGDFDSGRLTVPVPISFHLE